MKSAIEYGVLIKGSFMSYQDLAVQVRRGTQYRDGSNNGLRITKGTFSWRNHNRNQKK